MTVRVVIVAPDEMLRIDVVSIVKKRRNMVKGNESLLSSVCFKGRKLK